MEALKSFKLLLLRRRYVFEEHLRLLDGFRWRVLTLWFALRF